MSDFYDLNLYAKFAGFRVLVLANRLGCSDDFSRAAHDRLAAKLQELVDHMRQKMAAERTLALNPETAEADDLGELVWALGQDFIYYWKEPDGIDLVENDIYVDWATKEWHDRRDQRWYSLQDFHPTRVDVARRLDGLGDIVAQIAQETDIRFNTYANDPVFAETEEERSPEEKDADDDWMEDPRRNPLWGPDTD